jgi:hypothetical protein
MEENPRLGLDEKELLKVITKYLKDTPNCKFER